MEGNDSFTKICDSEDASIIQDISSSSSKTMNKSSFAANSQGLTPPSSPQRRAIFDSFWKKYASSSCSSSSIREDVDNVNASSDGSIKRNALKMEPSYLGIYSFAPPQPPPSPIMPGLSPLSESSSCLTPSPNGRPKSILRRRRHCSLCDCCGKERDLSRPRSLTIRGPYFEAESIEDLPPLPITCTTPNLFENLSLQEEGQAKENRSSSSASFCSLSNSTSMHSTCDHRHNDTGSTTNHHPSVHFDPTIRVREVLEDGFVRDQTAEWFNDRELQSFLKEAVHLCHCSALNSIKTYSFPAVAKAHAKAREVGIKDPSLTSFASSSLFSSPPNRPLFADPILHTTDEDATVHDGSKAFFLLTAKTVRHILIVDESWCTLKLFRRKLLSMFPHALVDVATSGEEALNRMLEWDDSTKEKKSLVERPLQSHSYDIVVVDEGSWHNEKIYHDAPSFTMEPEHLLNDCGDGDCVKGHAYCLGDMSGSQFLYLLNDIENRVDITSSASASQEFKEHKKQRRSLKIGVSISLSQDCDALRRGGADVFWSKPPPKATARLRNELLNLLLGKREKSVFVCGG